MFYELNTWDLLGRNPWKRSPDDHPEESFEGSVNQYAQITLLVDPNASFIDQAMISNKTTASTALVAESKLAVTVASDTVISIPNLLPDG
jgi:predicted transcriptional regulator